MCDCLYNACQNKDHTCKCLILTCKCLINFNKHYINVYMLHHDVNLIASHAEKTVECKGTRHQNEVKI